MALNIRIREGGPNCSDRILEDVTSMSRDEDGNLVCVTAYDGEFTIFDGTIVEAGEATICR